MIQVSNLGQTISQSGFRLLAVVDLCVNSHQLKIEASLLKVRNMLTYGYNDKSVGLGLTLYSFRLATSASGQFIHRILD